MINRFSLSLVLALAWCSSPPAFAQMGGMGNGMGSGMLVTADDGSLLVTHMDGGMMGSQPRSLVNISSSGSVRWRLNFSNQWPMMPATKKALVVFALVDNWWMGGGQNDTVIIEAVTLSTGVVRWKTTLEGEMSSYPQFSRDGKRIYVTLGDYSDTYTMTGRRVVALDLNGKVLWSTSLSESARRESQDPQNDSRSRGGPVGGFSVPAP